MLERIFGDWRQSAGLQLRLAAIAAAASFAATAALGLLCAAAFVFVMQRAGVLEACLAVAAVFLLVALALVAICVVLRRRATHAEAVRKSAQTPLLADPMVLATGLQILQTVGIKRALTLLAIVGAGFLVSRPAARA